MELLKVENGQALVSSRKIAENFGKRHADVIKSIEKHKEDLYSTEKSVQWFYESSYQDSTGKSCKEYLMNRDGFSLLVMSFNNTRDVLEWKLKYIKAFNDMEHQLRTPYSIPQVVAMLSKEFLDLEKRVSTLEVTPIQETGEIEEIITSIAQKTGIWYPKVYEAIYREVEQNYGYDLDELLANHRAKMKRNKICKTRINNFKKIDLVKQNKELFSCFSKATKEMEQKYKPI